MNQPQGTTWQPLIGPHGTSTTNRYMPRVNHWFVHVFAAHQLLYFPVNLPCQPATSATDVTRATCHPYSGDTCHLWIGPSVRQTNPSRSATCCHPRLPCVICWIYHVTCMDCMVCTVSMTRGLYGLYSHPFFYLFNFSDRTRYILHTEPV
jgi:hypothetical protein